MDCPHCGSPMTADTLDTRLRGTVTVDLCGPCQLFWFDAHESLQLSAAATLKLFKTIGEQAARGRPMPTTAARCPRCRSPLVLTHDMQRSTKFQYWRCEHGHGRLIDFYDFLREKDFIRPLSPEQLAELRRNVGEVNCSNCGAPVDPGASPACTHCGTPLSMLDMHHAEQLIAELQHAGDPVAPAAAGAAAPEHGTAGAAPTRDGPAKTATGSTDLVGAGLNALLARLLTLPK